MFAIELANASDVTADTIRKALACVRAEHPHETIEQIRFCDDGILVERFSLPTIFIDFPVQRIGD